ncbi:MAG: beta-ketoacyl synthase N-terminal-like domain-containing protein [Balneolaceae bacterium]
MSEVKEHQANNVASGDLSSLQRAAITIRELKAKLESTRKAQQEPIAIVGMACRFPGSPDLEGFWELLKNGMDAVSEVPPERWDLEQWFDPNPNTPGKINTRYGGFIDEVECFDAAFFGIPPREARQMDPGQRILLQLVWNALEHAAIPPHSLRGSNTGFFVGMSQNDYGSMQINGDPEEISAYSGTGNGGCFASGRISYQFGFNGPTLTSDTACSSSLVALSQALSALRSGESDLALASGVHLNLTPPMQIFFSRTQSFSPSGRCHTFDAGANGFVLGEGAGVVVLQRLSDAIRDGRKILGVIRAASVNHGGASGGLTVPNEAAQEKLIRNVLKTAKVDPDSIDYVETHGTGTNLGDPIEVGALRSVFGKRPAENPLLIGSVKTNIGHLNAAAGMAGLIKTVLMLQHRQIVPNLHFNKPNPEIPWEGFPAEVPTKFMSWDVKKENPRRAGLSSFGLSGTNVHVVLEEAPDVVSEHPAGVTSAVESGDEPRTTRVSSTPLTHSDSPESPRLYTISAHTVEALREQASLHRSKLSDIRTADELAACCFRANAGRSHLDHRAVILCTDPASLRDGLEAVQTGASRSNVLQGHNRKGAQTKLLMRFSGNPVPQLKELLPLIPFCRDELNRLGEIFSAVSGGDLSEEFGKSGNKNIHRFAAFLILARLWQTWGIRPSAIQAAGAGEWAAAVIANAMPVEAAFRALADGGSIPEMTRPDVTLLRADGSRLEKLSDHGHSEAGQSESGQSVPDSEASTTTPDGYTATLHIGSGEVANFLNAENEKDIENRQETTIDSWTLILKSLSRLYILGVPVDWYAFESIGEPGAGDLSLLVRKLPDLPGYPFAKDRHWLDKPGVTVQKSDTGQNAGATHTASVETSNGNESSTGIGKESGESDGNENENGVGIGNESGHEIGNGSRGSRGNDEVSLARIMEMQLRLTTESLRQVTNQQFEYLRKNGVGRGRRNRAATPPVPDSARDEGFATTASKPDASSVGNPVDSGERSDFKKPSTPVTDPVQCGSWKLLLLEGDDDADLETQKKKLIQTLKTDPESILEQSRKNLRSATTGGKRLMLTWQTPGEAISMLEEPANRRVVTAGRLAEESSLVCMFPGVGDHYLNLGKGLYENEPLFRQVVDECCAAIEPVLGTDLRSIIYPAADPNNETASGRSKTETDRASVAGGHTGNGAGNSEGRKPQANDVTEAPKEKPRFDLKAMLGRGAAPDPRQERMNQTRFSQPLNFIIEYALGSLWQARGVKPAAMIGYSIGEYCAAVLSGVMTLEDALLLVTKRAQLIETIPSGAMLAVPLGAKEVEEYLGSDLSVAISSTPAQSVVAGPVPAVEALEKLLAERAIVCRRLQSTHAFHTSMLKPLHQPLLELTESFSLKAPKIPFISNVTGTWIVDSQATSAEYWAMHTWQTVQFSDGMGNLLSSEFADPENGRIFLEVGPGVSLGSFMLQHPASAKVKRKMNLASLRTMYEKMPDEQFLLNSVGKLYLAGYKFSTQI